MSKRDREGRTVQPLESLVDTALAAYEIAKTRQLSFSPAHPVDDFCRLSPVFNVWRRRLRKDNRTLTRLRVEEARELFCAFSMEYNNVQLPLDFYKSFPEEADIEESPEGSALRKALEATHRGDWLSGADM